MSLFNLPAREKENLRLNSCYWWLATFKLCTPANIDVAALAVCGIHHILRMKPFSLRNMCRATRSNSTGPTCVAA